YPAIGNLYHLTIDSALSPPALLASGDFGLVSIPLDGTAAAALNTPSIGIFQSQAIDPLNQSIVYAAGEEGLRIYNPTFGTWARPVASPVGFVVATNTNPKNVYALGGG